MYIMTVRGFLLKLLIFTKKNQEWREYLTVDVKNENKS